MPKRSILVCALALFVLVVGWPMTSAQAHCEGNHTGDHPHCPGGGGGDPGLYDVEVEGALYPIAPLVYPYLGEDGEQRSKPVTVYHQDLDLSMSYFWNEDFGGPAGNQHGENCFTGVHGGGTEGTPMLIKQAKDGTARVQYWFRGYGINGQDDGPEIKYQLVMSGAFSTTGDSVPWRPEESGQFTTVVFDEWIMGLEGKKNKNIACTGSGQFTSAVTITVTRTD